MTLMTTAKQETCSHERCDMEPCTAYDYLTYERDDVFGWGTRCEPCESFYPGTLPEEHAEERHEEAAR